ncbi:hypothetical protein ACFLTC_03515 [Chloroflexota bacterium]
MERVAAEAAWLVALWCTIFVHCPGRGEAIPQWVGVWQSQIRSCEHGPSKGGNRAMNARIHRSPRRRGWKLVTVVALALLAALLIGVQSSYAQSRDGLCLRDAADFDQTGICTASHVQVVGFELLGGPGSCTAGESIPIILRIKLKSGAKRRYDIGFYISEDGRNAMDRGTSCFRDYLHPVFPDNSDLDLTKGVGPFYNGEIGVSPTDTCGDLKKTQVASYVVGPVSITCSDSDGDGKLDLGTVVSWANDRKSTCNSEADAVPIQESRCASQTLRLGDIRVEPSKATLVVQKVLEPPADSGFNLKIDGESRASDVGDGGTTGPVEVSASDVQVGDLHTVGETAVAPTLLVDYDTRISCLDVGGDEFSTNDAGPLSVYLEPTDVMTCTITNTRRGAGIEIINESKPPDPSESSPFTDSLDSTREELSPGQSEPSHEELEVGAVYSLTGEPLVSLVVTKTADPTSVYEPGGWIDYEVRVENSSPVSLTLAYLSDDVYGDIADAANPSLGGTTCSAPQPLPAGGSYTCHFEAEVTGLSGEEQTGMVTAIAVADAGGTVTAQDQAPVLILGEPPDTGGGLPSPAIIGVLAVVGTLLLALGLLVRRQAQRSG